MSETEILEKLDSAVEKRRRARDARDPVAVKRLDKELARLYDDLRTERARDLHGDRRTIRRRARVELGIEKLSQV